MWRSWAAGLAHWAREKGKSWACVEKGLGWDLGRFELVSGCWAAARERLLR